MTGGFDGRSIVSSLLKYNIPFKAYSFGKPGGENTKVPLRIKEKINVDYEPIYLDKKYEKSYAKFAKEVIYFSDGLSFHERANYLYAFEKLQKYSQHILTGLIAGEILRPIHLRTDYMNQLYYDVFYEGKDLDILGYLENKKIKDFISLNFIKDIKPTLTEKIQKKKKEIENLKKQKN